MALVCPVCEYANETSKCERCDTDLSPLARLTEFPAQHYAEGRALLRQGDVHAAIGKLSVVAALDPANTEAQKTLAEALEIQTAANKATAGTQVRHLRAIIWGLSTAVAVVVALAVGQLVGGHQKADGPGARLQRVQEWLNANRELTGVSAALKGNVIAVSGDLPTVVHLRWVQEGIMRAAGTPVDMGAVKVAQPASPAPVIYRVRAGDSYWMIAQRRYGTALVWKSIAEANQDRLAPGRLLAGDEVVLPAVTFTPNQTMKGIR